MILKDKQIKFLRKKGHALKPVVRVGNAGLSEAVLSELGLALEHHELLKVKIHCGDREERDALIEEICKRSDASLVQKIGHVALIYRPASELPKILLPA